MDEFMKDRLEEYLSGSLEAADQKRFEELLANDARAAEEIAGMQFVSELFVSLRAPEDELLAPAPGFYARLSRSIEQEKGIPFWTAFLEPVMLRRLAFASLMWLALLGSLSVLGTLEQSTEPQVANGFFTEAPHPEYNVRFSSDLEQNRNQMLAVMLAGD